jgi:hypothetical protein
MCALSTSTFDGMHVLKKGALSHCTPESPASNASAAQPAAQRHTNRESNDVKYVCIYVCIHACTIHYIYNCIEKVDYRKKSRMFHHDHGSWDHWFTSTVASPPDCKYRRPISAKVKEGL